MVISILKQLALTTNGINYMTMHLIHGIREPRSKIKAKKKPGWKQREAEYQDWLKSIGASANTKKTTKKSFEVYQPKQDVFRRETQYIPSLNTNLGVATKKETPKYSGDYLIGIATMHKSNLVPVGKEDDPESYSKMRRS